MEEHEEVARRVFETFLGKPRKRQRMKPNRCLGCGKVSKHIFHNAECQAAWRARQS